MPGTLSQLVDELLIRAVTPGATADMTSYVNSTVRESSGRNHFYKDMIEDEITGILTADHTWNYPIGFRRMKAVKYNRLEKQIPLIPPGKTQEGKTEYWYEAGNYKVFSGVGGSSTESASVQIAYFLYPKRLIYYAATPEGTRPAFWDEANEKWQYWDGVSVYVDTLGSTALDEAARAKVTNWLIDDWYDMIMNGALAKFYLVRKDERSQGIFSLYKTMQNEMVGSEFHETWHNESSGRK